MCKTDNRDALRNGHAADLATQGHALADVLDTLSSMEKTLSQIPTRSEVRDMIHDSLRIHIESCDAARDDNSKKEESNRFKFGLGKILGLEAEGRVGAFLAVLIWVVAAVVAWVAIPHVIEWLSAWLNR